MVNISLSISEFEKLISTASFCSFFVDAVLPTNWPLHFFKDTEGHTILTYLIKNSDKRALSLIASGRVDVKLHGGGMSPLAWAVQVNCLTIVKALIKAGADVNEKDLLGNNVAVYMQTYSQNMVDYLTLSTVLDINNINKQGLTIEQVLSQRGFGSIADLWQKIRLKTASPTMQISRREFEAIKTQLATLTAAVNALAGAPPPDPR